MVATVAASPLDVLVERVVALCSPVEVILFGSRARGDARPDSDYDLLVVLDCVDDRFGQTVALQRLTRGLPIEADFVLTTPQQIAAGGHIAGTVLRPALRDGQSLYRRDRLDNAQATRRWLKYAEEDAVVAHALLADDNISPRHACYYAQQAAEKALKAALTFVDIDPPRSHNLDALRNTLPPGWAVQSQFRELEHLAMWNAVGRYPADWPEATSADARSAVELAESVLDCVRGELQARGLVPE
jgi:HEPN domain-containing protein/predicted nucleotidyltransferase